MAMEKTNCDLGVASEGSFGPHPSIFFASADDEFLIFIDKKNDLEIIVRELSTDTNFNGQAIRSENDLVQFASLVKFPSHALILKPSKDNTEDMVKGITNADNLKTAFEDLIAKHGQVYAETDMRAMLNPSRMAVIAKAAKKLVDKIQSRCPECNTPGFGVIETKTGLPCNLCSMPTASVQSLIYQCLKCEFNTEKPPPHGKTSADPMYCDYCNP